MALPRLFPIRQRFVNRALPDVSKATEEAFLRSHVLDALLPGQSVAVCVGSRGISNLAEIVKKTVDLVRARGATPFIVPAMGSHGRSSAGGRRISSSLRDFRGEHRLRCKGRYVNHRGRTQSQKA